MANISKITLPSGTTYDIKDATARTAISNLTGAMHWIGITTTALTDGSTITTIVVNSENVTVGANDAGSVAVYGESEFVWNGSKWQLFGSAGSFKALAFKDTASGTITPRGSVSVSTATTENKTATVSVASSGTATYTPGGSVAAPTFTGTQATINSSGSFTPRGTVSLTNENKTTTVSKATSGTATYTPEGSVTPNVQVSKATVKTIDNAGSLPSCSLPTMTTSVSGETLTIEWTSGTFSAGALPTTSDVSVATGISSQTATFSGTGVRLVTGNIPVPTSAAFSGTEDSVGVEGTYTPEGTNTAPAFTGTGVRLETGNIAVPKTYSASFTGTEDTVTVS